MSDECTSWTVPIIFKMLVILIKLRSLQIRDMPPFHRNEGLNPQLISLNTNKNIPSLKYLRNISFINYPVKVNEIRYNLSYDDKMWPLFLRQSRRSIRKQANLFQ